MMISSQPLFNLIRQCKECPLHKGCIAPVPGVGPINARVMVVGEGPGEREDERGIPFTGATGQILEELLTMAGLDGPGDVYLSNTVKCLKRTEYTPQETDGCSSRWLQMEIDVVRPQMIIAMGRAAIRTLTGDADALVDHYQGIPRWRRFPGHDRDTLILPMYNPAVGLRDTSQLRMVWDGWKVAGAILSGDDPTTYVPVDHHPNPRYKEVTTTDHALELLGKPEFALDTETIIGVDGDPVLWSVQVSDKEGEAWFIPAELIPDPNTAIPPTSLVWVHNYLYDRKFINLPRFADTMVMAYLLGLPQGLKQLAYKLAGMDMSSYDEYVKPKREEIALKYLDEAEGSAWPSPVPVITEEWDNKLGRMHIKVRNPHHINRKLWRLVDDWRKDPTNTGVSVYQRWHSMGEEERREVEKVLGPMPEAGLRDVDRDQAVFYSSRDADATIRIAPILRGMLKEGGLERVLDDIDLPTLPILMEMMDEGMGVDLDHFKKLSNSCRDDMAKVAEECKSMMGMEVGFNPNSSDQVAKLLYSPRPGGLGFEPTRRTPTGDPSTDDRELKKIDHPVISRILEYRKVLKLKTSYADAILRKAVDKGDGKGPRVHCTLRATRTETGRLSAADPNLQAIPVRTDVVRGGFVAGVGRLMVGADYSQIEMRLLAHTTRSPYLLDLFWQGLDIHTQTASILFGVNYEEAKDDRYRYPTKRINFGIVYGITAHGLYEGLIEEGVTGWGMERCEDLLLKYDAMFPEVGQYRREQIRLATLNGYVTDFVGRRRWMPEMVCPVKRIRAEGERAAGNMPIQSGAQAIIKAAANKLKELRDGGYSPWPFVMLMQIHDELIFEVEEGVGTEVEGWTAWVKWVMEGIGADMGISVPLVADVVVGHNWGELK